jgi:YVTN family beta-propeller protein
MMTHPLTHMKNTLPLLTLAAASLFAASAARADYHILSRVLVASTDKSRYDYLEVDPVNHHLFMANDKRFLVFDTESGEKVGQMGPAARAHGIAIIADTGHGFLTSGDTNSILMFDLKSLKVLKIIKSTGKNPDGIKYDAASKKLYVANGASGSVTVIDPAAGEVTGTISIPGGKLEALGFDHDGHGFVNDEANNCVHVFDVQAMKATVNWPSAPGEGGTGLAVDPEHHRVFSTCGNKKLVVIDTQSGKVVATPEIGEDPDAAVFDPKTQRIFVSNADATMTVLHEDSPDQYSLVQTIQTGTGAKTFAFSEGKIYCAVAKFDNGKPRPAVIPGSLEILIIGEN